MVCVYVDWVEKQIMLYFPLLSRVRLCCFSPKALRTGTSQSTLQTHTGVPREPWREKIWKARYLGSESLVALPHGKVPWKGVGARLCV